MRDKMLDIDCPETKQKTFVYTPFTKLECHLGLVYVANYAGDRIASDLQGITLEPAAVAIFDSNQLGVPLFVFRTTKAPRSYVVDLVFSFCDTYLAVVTTGRNIRALEVWNLLLQKRVLQVQAEVRDVCFSSDSRFVLYRDGRTNNVVITNLTTLDTVMDTIEAGSLIAEMDGRLYVAARRGTSLQDNAVAVRRYGSSSSQKKPKSLGKDIWDPTDCWVPSGNNRVIGFVLWSGNLGIYCCEELVWEIKTGGLAAYKTLWATPWRNVLAEQFGDFIIDIHDLFGYLKPFLLNFLMAQLPFCAYLLLEIFDWLMAEERQCSKKNFSRWMHYEKIVFVQEFLTRHEEKKQTKKAEEEGRKRRRTKDEKRLKVCEKEV